MLERMNVKIFVMRAWLIAVVVGLVASVSGQEKQIDEETFFGLLSLDKDVVDQSVEQLREGWEIGFTAPVLEIIHLTADIESKRRFYDFLDEQNQQNIGYSSNDWFKWLWEKETKVPVYYPEFKAQLYRLIDERFAGYFSSDRKSTIRLDEVRWGGVKQDGIPPLRNPKMIEVEEAGYLADDNIVFGLFINGEARAYPKRILAWHEMFTDNIQGIPIAGVYCTLCGSMIAYRSEFNGEEFLMGTSGFLYRSNKLMYDKSTQSLWNTLWGEPVVGPLVGKGIRLEYFSTVTTTWGEWKERHPQTTVLSLETGHQRDYGEGVAYADYFATDELMFNTQEADNRLLNKDDILAIRLKNYPDQPLAISSKFLAGNKKYHSKIGAVDFVVLTDRSGASRVYESRGLRFKKWDKRKSLVDNQQRTWQLTEAYLINDQGEKLMRIPAHRAFWFGWKAAYPKTKLISFGVKE